MERRVQLRLLLRRWGADPRLRVYHMVLLMAILSLWLAQQNEGTLSVSRRKLMTSTRIGGIGTYHRYMKDLREYGYIDYAPSYHPMYGSTVSLKV